MVVMVTGGLGAIGSFAVRNLVERGERPLVFDYRNNYVLIRDLLDNVDIVNGDINNWANIIETLKKWDITRIIHTAALMPGPCKVNPAQAVQVNIQGFINVAEAARLFNVKRLVFASTVGVYAKMDKNHMHPYYESINEDYPKQPHSLYDATRFFCERYGLQMTENYKLDFVACRFAHTFGPGKFTHGPMATVASIVDNSLTGKPVKILKGGEQKVDFIYNRDSGRGLVHACFAENLNYKQFNIGSGKGYKLLDFANIVKKYLPTAEIEIGPGLDFMSFDLYPIYDISRAKNELGFEPVYDLEAAIKDYIEIANRLNYSQEFSGILQQVSQ